MKVELWAEDEARLGVKPVIRRVQHVAMQPILIATCCEVVIIVRRLIRRGWTNYRWEGRPCRRP